MSRSTDMIRPPPQQHRIRMRSVNDDDRHFEGSENSIGSYELARLIANGTLCPEI
jgi:hypothetical protein